MKHKDLLLALLVVTVWGASFTVIRIGLDELPPMLLAALRFALAAVPAVFLVRAPAVPLRYLLSYGATLGIGQFGCMFYAMHIGLPAGLASVVLQSQAFFTLLLAALMLQERVNLSQLVGLSLAAAGLILIGSATGLGGTRMIPLSAMLLAISAAAFWGISNIVVRKAVDEAAVRERRVDMFSLVVWSSLVPPLPLLGLAWLMHSPEEMRTAITGISLTSLVAIAYLSFAATLFGFGAWSKLLSMYSASRVAPLSLLVPVTGLLTARLVLNEQMLPLQWLGCLLILLGLAAATFGLPGSWRRKTAQP